MSWLNVLERELAQLIDRAPVLDRIIADGRRMFAALGQRYPHFESHDRAEEKHAAVAAASVVAKVVRDHRFAQIRARYEGELGPITGDDPRTQVRDLLIAATTKSFERSPRVCAAICLMLRQRK